MLKNAVGKSATSPSLSHVTPSANAAGRRLLETPEPASLGPETRPGTLNDREVHSAVERVCGPLSLPGEQERAVLALTLLWHDHLEASHRISQGIETTDGSFIHAIMHRREPDYWNSKYWWRQTGDHPVLPRLGERASECLSDSSNASLNRRLVSGGYWKPDAFVDACESVAGRPADDPEVSRLRELQRLEFEVLLDYLLESGCR